MTAVMNAISDFRSVDYSDPGPHVLPVTDNDFPTVVGGPITVTNVNKILGDGVFSLVNGQVLFVPPSHVQTETLNGVRNGLSLNWPPTSQSVPATIPDSLHWVEPLEYAAYELADGSKAFVDVGRLPKPNPARQGEALQGWYVKHNKFALVDPLNKPHKLTPADVIKRSAAVGLDGSPGYEFDIVAGFEGKAKHADINMQAWQKNTITTTIVGTDATGALLPHIPAAVTKDIVKVTPKIFYFEYTYKLGLTLIDSAGVIILPAATAPATKIAFISERVQKRLSFNM